MTAHDDGDLEAVVRGLEESLRLAHALLDRAPGNLTTAEHRAALLLERETRFVIDALLDLMNAGKRSTKDWGAAGGLAPAGRSGGRGAAGGANFGNKLRPPAVRILPHPGGV